jgi:hypothetical protein
LSTTPVPTAINRVFVALSNSTVLAALAPGSSLTLIIVNRRNVRRRE